MEYSNFDISNRERLSVYRDAGVTAGLSLLSYGERKRTQRNFLKLTEQRAKRVCSVELRIREDGKRKEVNTKRFRSRSALMGDMWR